MRSAAIAASKIVWSGFRSRPTSATVITSCPAARNFERRILSKMHSSMSNLSDNADALLFQQAQFFSRFHFEQVPVALAVGGDLDDCFAGQVPGDGGFFNA